MMKKLPVSAMRARVMPLSYLALGLSVSCAAQAQNGAAVPAPASALAPSSAPLAALPLAPDISILIVALDDLEMPDGITAPAYAPPRAPAARPAPIAPTDGMPGAVTPTAWNAQAQRGAWRAQAQIRPSTKEEKRLQKEADKARKLREKEAEEKRLFDPSPVPITRYSPNGDVEKPLAPGAGAPIVRAPNDPLNALLATPATLPALPTTGVPGRSQNMAVALRRALLAQGYKDVQVVTPQSNTIIRAIGDGRLSSRVVDELKRSLAILAANDATGAPADVSARFAAGRAASRIGQATGYRAVVGFAVGGLTQIEVVGAGVGITTEKIGANMVVADAQRESVEPLKFVATGDSEELWRETGAASGAELLNGALRDWPASGGESRARLAQVHFDAARAAFERGDTARAQDEMNQSIALDASQAQVFVLRGDILNSIEPGSGLAAYQRANEMNAASGQVWARIASAYAYSKTPDWPLALDAARRAQALNFDSAQLRVAMATAQYGRAELFRGADYPGKAEEAEIEARGHLDRAIQLSPDDVTAVRLLARNLLSRRRFEEAARTLDSIAPRYPNDLEIQSQYALALGNQSGREEDAFASYARVWKLTNQRTVTVDAETYRTLATGFDQRLFNLGKIAVQLSRGVASRAILRETALIQLTKLKEEMDEAQDAIAIMQPSSAIGATSVAARIFAANQVAQALEQLQSYLETGQISYFNSGDALYRGAIAQLNTARSAQ